jgi:hypothetical protein
VKSDCQPPRVDVGELVARIGFHLGVTFEGGEPMQFAPEAMRDFVRAKAAEGHGPLGPSSDDELALCASPPLGESSHPNAFAV